jgi:hypothetical protein
MGTALIDALFGTAGGHLAAAFTIAALVVAVTDGAPSRRHDHHDPRELP